MAKTTTNNINLTDVTTLERAIFGIQDATGNRILVKRVAKTDKGVTPELSQYNGTEVFRFQAKSCDDYMVRLEDYKAPVKVTGVKKLSDDALRAEMVARGLLAA